MFDVYPLGYTYEIELDLGIFNHFKYGWIASKNVASFYEFPYE